MKKLLLVLIKLYQRYLSPDQGFLRLLGLGPVCRFTPTCSEYTYQAIEKYGTWRGIRLGVKRVSRCHPLSPGGWDPVR